MHSDGQAVACDPPEYDAEADFLERTPKHFLDPDPQDSTSCLVCGSVDGYGVLHVQELTEVPPLPEPRYCLWCAHDIHEGACRFVRTVHIGLQGREVQHCHCKGNAA